MNATEPITRRDFFKLSTTAGAGLILGMRLPTGALSGQDIDCQGSVFDPNAYVRIDPDGTVTLIVHRSEMGQGTLTGLAQMVAEELECDWSKVTTEYPTPGENVRRDEVWRSFSTGGSQGIRGSQLYVRKGGAVAREMLVQAKSHISTATDGSRHRTFIG